MNAKLKEEDLNKMKLMHGLPLKGTFSPAPYIGKSINKIGCFFFIFYKRPVVLKKIYIAIFQENVNILLRLITIIIIVLTGSRLACEAWS